MNIVVFLAVCSALSVAAVPSVHAVPGTVARAADSHIHGVVRDSATRAPLHGAVVRVMETGSGLAEPKATTKGAVTDRTGVFHLHDLTADSLRLRVSFIGYATADVPVVLSRSRREVHLEILLGPAALRGGEVTVTGERIANAALPTQQARVLDETEIDEHRGQTFADALTQVPGVTLVQTGPGLKKPMINGMMGTRLVLRNNSLVQEGQQWGIEHAPEIDAMSPSTITVVKGPAAVKFGPNALGGVIELESRPIRKDPGVHGEATVNMFSNGRQGALGAFIESGSVAALPVAVRAQASVRMGGDAAAPDYLLNNTGVRELNASVCAEMNGENSGLRLLGSVFSTTLGIFKGAHIGNAGDMLRAIERGRPASSEPFSYAITNPRQEVSHASLSARAFAKITSTEKLLVTAGYQVNDRSEFDAHNVRIVGRGTDPLVRAADSLARLAQALATPAMNLLLSTGSLDAELEHSLGDDIRGSVGVASILQVNDRSGTVQLIPDYRLWGVGVFAYENMYVDAWTFSAGARMDMRDLQAQIFDRVTDRRSPQSRRWTNMSAGVGATWEAREDLSLSGNLSTAWRPPQANELYSNDVHHGSAIYEIGDSMLSAERVTGSDLALHYHSSGVQIDAAGFVNSIDNYIMSVPDPANPTITIRGTFPTFVFTQMPAVLYGGDVSMILPIAQRLSVLTQASMVRGRDRQRSEPLLFMPADRVRVTVHVHGGDVGFVHDAFADVSVLAVRRQTNVVDARDYVEPPMGYATLDLTVGGVMSLPFGSARVSVSCVNVLNTAYRDYLSQYRYFADDPGRNIILRWTTSL